MIDAHECLGILSKSLKMRRKKNQFGGVDKSLFLGKGCVYTYFKQEGNEKVGRQKRSNLTNQVVTSEAHLKGQ